MVILSLDLTPIGEFSTLQADPKQPRCGHGSLPAKDQSLRSLWEVWRPRRETELSGGVRQVTQAHASLPHHPSSTPLEALVLSHDWRAMTRSPSPRAAHGDLTSLAPHPAWPGEQSRVLSPISTGGLTPFRLSPGFCRQEYSSGLPFPPPGDLPNPGIKPRSPTL